MRAKTLCLQCDRPGVLKQNSLNRWIRPLEHSTAAVASMESCDGEVQGLIAHALTRVLGGNGDKADDSLTRVEDQVGGTGGSIPYDRLF